MNAIAFIKKHATAGIALAAVLGFSAFNISENKLQTEVTFVYTPAPGDVPYSKTSVEDLSNWERGAPCNSSLDQDKACSITVPLSSTMNSGQELDPNEVQIESEQHGTSGSYAIVLGSSSRGYTEAINQPLN